MLINLMNELGIHDKSGILNDKPSVNKGAVKNVNESNRSVLHSMAQFLPKPKPPSPTYMHSVRIKNEKVFEPRMTARICFGISRQLLECERCQDLFSAPCFRDIVMPKADLES